MQGRALPQTLAKSWRRRMLGNTNASTSSSSDSLDEVFTESSLHSQMSSFHLNRECDTNFLFLRSLTPTHCLSGGLLRGGHKGWGKSGGCFFWIIAGVLGINPICFWLMLKTSSWTYMCQNCDIRGLFVGWMRQIASWICSSTKREVFIRLLGWRALFPRYTQQKVFETEISYD